MIKNLKHIQACILNGLFLSLILFASGSVFDNELSEHYESTFQAGMIDEIFDHKTDAVLTDAFLLDFNFNLFSKDKADRQTKTNKYFLLNTNTKIITAYKHSCKTHLNLRPILYSCSKIYMSSYLLNEDYPSVS